MSFGARLYSAFALINSSREKRKTMEEGTSAISQQPWNSARPSNSSVSYRAQTEIAMMPLLISALSYCSCGRGNQEETGSGSVV